MIESKRGEGDRSSCVHVQLEGICMPAKQCIAPPSNALGSEQAKRRDVFGVVPNEDIASDENFKQYTDSRHAPPRRHNHITYCLID